MVYSELFVTEENNREGIKLKSDVESGLLMGVQVKVQTNTLIGVVTKRSNKPQQAKSWPTTD